MAARTDMAEPAVAVESVTLTAAPWANKHALSYWLTTFGASENSRQDLIVSFYKSPAPHLAPVKLPHFG